MRTDAIILAQAFRQHENAKELAELADLALALTSAYERSLETTLTGEAFAIAARAWPSDVFARLPSRCPYPVAVGAIGAAQGLDLHDLLSGFVTSGVHAQVSVAVRLVPLGQTAGLQVMAGLETAVGALADAASCASLEDIGSVAYAADIAQMRHETIGVRVFRS